MRYSKIYSCFLITCLITCGYSLSASHYEFEQNTQQPDSIRPQYIIFFDVLQPLAFGKTGLAFSIKKPGLEYLIYANYIFRRDGMNEDPFYSSSERQWGAYTRKPFGGAELGVQIRLPFGSDWEKQSYAKFIDDDWRTGYFFGSWAEMSYKETKSQYSGYQSVKIRSAKMGGLIGWSGANDRIGVDVFGGLGVGRVNISLKDSPFYENIKDHSFLFVYKIGFKFGIKL